VLLLSGGLDSAALLSFYADLPARVQALYVDYGQAARREEAKASEAVAKYFGVGYDQLSISRVGEVPTGIALPGRNALLLLAALAKYGDLIDQVALGIHSSSRYWDCTQAFLDAMQTVFDGYTLGLVNVAAPFITWNKTEIWRYAVDRVPIPATYSCEMEQGPCGACPSCRDIAVVGA
jgi:7-cyano-7-deazaguanine synthase